MSYRLVFLIVSSPFFLLLARLCKSRSFIYLRPQSA
jgi:hypothetical protein